MLTATEQFSPSAKAPQVREFSAEVRKMQSDLAKMSASERVAQAGFMSIEDSAIPVFDALGQVRMSMGRQNDGTFAVVYVDGPPPPKPNRPIVAARQLGVYVAVDGTFAGGYARPADVARFDIHMSTTSGFTPDGTTIVGDVTDAGGVLIGGVANVTQYVKVVAVSRAKDSTTGAVIASPPTDEIAVLPLPISQVAVGAIGAQQFAADIGFVSRLLVGNPNAGHVELEGRTGMSPGLFAYDNGLNPTFGLDGLTGSITMRGTLRSADSGERLVWREYSWTNSIRAYPSTGSNFAELYARTFTDGGVDYGAFLLSGPPLASNKKRSFLWVTQTDIALYRTPDSGNTYTSGTVLVNDDGVSIEYRNNVGTVYGNLRVNSTGPWMSYGPSGSSGVYCNNGEIYLKASSAGYVDIWPDYTIFRFGSGRFQMSYNGSPLLSTSTTNCAIQFNTTGVDIYNPSTSEYLYVGLKDFVKYTSSRETKTDIEDLPFDPERVTVDAPAQQYEYIVDQRDRRGRYRKAPKQIGPMAEDMPAQLVSAPDANGDVGLYGFNMLGVLWAASASQTKRLDDLTRRLDALGAA